MRTGPFLRKTDRVRSNRPRKNHHADSGGLGPRVASAANAVDRIVTSCRWRVLSPGFCPISSTHRYWLCAAVTGTGDQGSIPEREPEK